MMCLHEGRLEQKVVLVQSAGCRTRRRSRSSAWLYVVAILTTLNAAPAIAWGQPVSGALGVALTVLPPVGTQPAELTSLRMDRDGTLRLETTPPITGAVSAIVMSTVASSANGFVPVAQSPVLVQATHRRERHKAARRPHASRPPLRYEVELGPEALHSESFDVSMLVTFLVVPGT